MIQEILEILHEQGPRTIPQLALILWCDEEDICPAMSILLLSHQVYWEVDGTFWFAQEIAA